MNKLSIVLFMLLSSCTAMSPLDKLYDGLDTEIQLEKLNETVLIVGPLDVYSECISGGVNPFLAVLGSPLMGCAILTYGQTPGTFDCTIYQAFDFDFIYTHEHQHCLGYQD